MESQEATKWQRIQRSGYLHLGLLSLSMAYALIRIFTTPLPFTWQHGVALALLAVCWIGRSLDRSWWKIAVVFTLYAAALYVAMFVSGEVMFATSLGHSASGFSFNIGIHPLFLILAIHAHRTWREDLRRWVSPPITVIEAERSQRSRVEMFMKNLEGKSTEELNALLRSKDGLVPDARTAALEILAQRTSGRKPEV